MSVPVASLPEPVPSLLRRPGGDGPAIASGATASVIVGASFAVSAALVAYPVATGQAGRYALAALVLTAAAGFRLGRPRPRELLLLAGVAVFGMAAFNAFVLAALDHAEPSVIGVVVGCSPLALALAGPLARGRAPGLGLLACAAVVAAGAALVNGLGGESDAAGIVLALGALVCEVLFSVLMAPVLGRLGVLRASAWACWMAAGGLAVVALATDVPRLPDREELAALGFLAMGATAAAFVLWYAAVARLRVERAGLLVGLMPVATLAVSGLLGYEAPTPGQIVGVLLVGAGVAAGLRVRPSV